MEKYLHKTLIDIATPDMTFEELYCFMNDLIVKKGFLNLDFLGNLGHSIAKHKNDRIYTEKGNHKRLSDVEMFTFEPHISIPDSKYGYKREDIYYFDNGKLIKLQAAQITDAIKANLIPPKLTPQQTSIIYASEADALNMALFGMTAKQWRHRNPDKKGNIMDYASINELICLSNMENINAALIADGLNQKEL